MGASIYVLHDNGQITEVRERAYDSELLLQQLLAKYPNILAGDQMNAGEPRRWILITQEMLVPDSIDGSGRWSLDHLFLDQEGVPTLVEVKRSTDSRIRREVVGQMLDYAANAVVHWPIEAILSRFKQTCSEVGVDSEEALLELIGINGDAESFWKQVEVNLQAGKVRLVFVADEIPSELKRIIEFLNVQMNPAEVLGVEIKQFVGEGLKTLVPKLIGRTESALQRKLAASGREVISESEFWQLLSQTTSEAECRAVHDVVNWSNSAGLECTFKKDAKGAVAILSFNHSEQTYYPCAVNSRGYIAFWMRWLKDRPPFDDPAIREELQQQLALFDGFQLHAAGMLGFPRIPLSDLVNRDSQDRLIRALDWMIARIRATATPPDKTC